MHFLQDNQLKIKKRKKSKVLPSCAPIIFLMRSEDMMRLIQHKIRTWICLNRVYPITSCIYVSLKKYHKKWHSYQHQNPWRQWWSSTFGRSPASWISPLEMYSPAWWRRRANSWHFLETVSQSFKMTNSRESDAKGRAKHLWWEGGAISPTAECNV